MSNQHPDIVINARNRDGQEILGLRLVTMVTAKFPHGVALGYDFTGPTRQEDAEAVANEIQEYMTDLFRACESRG